MKSVYEPGFTWEDFLNGTKFSIPFLLILTVHEFGHYFTAKYHNVKSSLPYYIPLPPLPGFPSVIGTLGAVIRLRSKVISNVHHFDIGLAGPLAGFIVALVILFYGFTHLPEPEYVFQFHPEYQELGLDYDARLKSYEPLPFTGSAVDSGVPVQEPNLAGQIWLVGEPKVRLHSTVNATFQALRRFEAEGKAARVTFMHDRESGNKLFADKVWYVSTRGQLSAFLLESAARTFAKNQGGELLGFDTAKKSVQP